MLVKVNILCQGVQLGCNPLLNENFMMVVGLYSVNFVTVQFLVLSWLKLDILKSVSILSTLSNQYY